MLTDDNTYCSVGRIVNALNSDPIGTQFLPQRLEHRRSGHSSYIASLSSTSSKDDGHIGAAVAIGDALLSTASAAALRRAVSANSAATSRSGGCCYSGSCMRGA